MNIPAVGSSNLYSSPKLNQGTGDDAKIRSLEQKLQKLNAEHQKAVQRKDEEQKNKIEKQIQEIQKQIQQLLQQEKEREQGDVSDKSEVPQKPSNSLDAGKYVDVYA